jgi:hypothetical protein
MSNVHCPCLENLPHGAGISALFSRGATQLRPLEKCGTIVQETWWPDEYESIIGDKGIKRYR